MVAIFSKANREQRRVDAAIRKINSIQPWFPRQHRFLEDDTRHVWQMAASQSGKTQVAVPKFLRRILRRQMDLRKKHGRWIEAPYWIVVPNSKVAIPVKAKVKDYLPFRSGLIDRAAQGQSRAFWSPNDGTGTAYMKYGAMIRYMSFAQGEGLVAESVHGMWIDECARCDDETIWENLFARTKETKGWMVGTSSPATKNAFYTKIYKTYKDDPEHSWLKWTSYDSARSKYSAITLAEVERAKAVKSPHLFAREYMADWASAEGMVYERFEQEKNVVQDVKFAHEPEFVIGLDIGATHPTAFEVVRFDGDEFVVFDEKTMVSPATSDILMAAVGLFFKYKPYRIYYDYATGGANLALDWDKTWSAVLDRKTEDQKLIYEMVFGVWCETFDKPRHSDISRQLFREISGDLAKKAKVSLDTAYKNVDFGIRLCGEGFASGRIKIASNCKAVIEEIDGYVWKDHANRDEPVKENDDHVDAMRYAIATFAAQRLSSSRSKAIFGVAA